MTLGVPDPKTLPNWIALAVVLGDHSLKKEAPAIRTAITGWLDTVIPGARSVPPGGSAG